ncbi:transglycosylase SLT domain-containing protein, partial [bacterium]|nr:transglycosylase SLT domain-containing protein [bacterium]
MIFKKFLLFVLIISFFTGCSSFKSSQKTQSSSETSVPAADYTFETGDADSLMTKDDIKSLEKIYNNALNSKKKGSRKEALDYLEEALIIISNNEIKSKEIYKNSDDYNEIVDFILDEYKNLMNEQLSYDNKLRKSSSTKTESTKKTKTAYTSKYKPLKLVRNSRVDKYIKYYQGRGKKHFSLYLQRMGRYKPLIEKILREEGLPEDLIYLAMVESGFNPNAYSRAHAVGMWQFISSTGRVYG